LNCNVILLFGATEFRSIELIDPLISQIESKAVAAVTSTGEVFSPAVITVILGNEPKRSFSLSNG
jgi:hypothetical protein